MSFHHKTTMASFILTKEAETLCAWDSEVRLNVNCITISTRKLIWKYKRRKFVYKNSNFIKKLIWWVAKKIIKNIYIKINQIF